MTEPHRDDSLKQYLIDEFIEDYEQGHLSRRDALKRLTGLVGASAAAAMIAACAPAPQATPTTAPPPTLVSPTQAPPTLVPATAVATAAPAATTAPATATTTAPDPTLTVQATATVMPNTNNVPVSQDDPAIQWQDVEFPSQGATVQAYLARPNDNETHAAILVCHENRGLTAHIKDVARRLAKAGYVALAIDLLSRDGGSAAVGEANAPGKLGNYPPAQMVGDFQAGLEFLKPLPFVAQGQYGMTGFCFGGGITWRCATQMPELRAAVPYYGPNPPLDDVPKIQAAVFGQYGANDSRIDAGIPAIEQAMKANNKIFEYKIYPGAGHAFNNDTGGNYNAQAAHEAWATTLAWFEKYVRA